MTRFKRCERGAVLVLAVPVLVMTIAACALGVDLGREAVDKRFDQKVADLAALDAARSVDGVLGTTNQAGYNVAAQTEAVASAVRNGFVVGVNDRTITAVVGTMNPDTNVFSTPGTDAVQVITASRIDNAFLPGAWNPTATAVALIAGATPPTTPTCVVNCFPTNNPAIGEFSVGSTLASLDTAPVKSKLDPLLKGWLGTSGSFSAVSYDGLASANVSLEGLQTALLGIGLNVGSVDQLLTSDIKLTDLLHATATALTAQGSNVAATEVNDIPIASISSTLTVKLGDLLSVASPNDDAMLSAAVNVYQLVTGAIEAADGQHFFAVDLTGLNAVPSVGGVSLQAYVISPAQTAIGPVGISAENAQISLKLGFNLTVAGLAPVAVSITYTNAEAKGTLSSITCGAAPSLGIAGNTAAVTEVGTAKVTVLGLPITMNIAASAGTTGPTPLTFLYPGGFGPTTSQHVGIANSGFGSAVTVSGNALAATVQPVLNTALPLLNTSLTTLLKPLLSSLGLDLASADIAALGIYPSPSQCGNPVLAK